MSKNPIYIKNTPGGKDQLKEQSHRRLAGTIADHLSEKEQDIRLIGLEGGWGTGKSNLIKLLATDEDLLKNTHEFFTFDLWGNQNDNLRNVFLSELISFLRDEKNILDAPKSPMKLDGKEYDIGWQERLNYLFSQKKTIEKKESPRLHPIASTLLIFVALSPFLKPFFEYLSSYNFGRQVVAIGFLLVIMFTVIFTVIHWIQEKLIHGREIGFSSFFYLIKGKRLESNIIESIRNSQPTVSDFRNIMNSISESLTKDLVIVYDNMDRLRNDQIHSIWSSIHTFFAESIYSKIWIIVAYDKNQIQQSFKDLSSYKDGESDKEGEYFIKKTFPFTYRVPPPVLTGWKDFFRTKLHESFMSGNVEDQNIILNLYDLHTEKKSTRDIIFFINELVKAKRQWKDIYSLKYQALFILNEKCILNNLPDSIINRNFIIGKNRIFDSDIQVQDIMASIAYNVSLEDASEVTLYSAITDALRSNHPENIDELLSHPSFQDIFERVIFRGDADVRYVILELDRIIKEKKHRERTDKIDNIFHLLSEQYLKMTYDKQGVDTRIDILIRRCPALKNSLIKHSIDAVTQFNDFDIELYCKFLLDLDGKYPEYKVLNNAPRLDLSVEQATSLIIILKEKYDDLNYKMPFEEMDIYFSENLKVSNTKEVIEYLVNEDIEKLIKTKETLISKFTTKISSGDLEFIHEYAQLLRISTVGRPIRGSFNTQFVESAGSAMQVTDTRFRDIIMLRLCLGKSYTGGDFFTRYWNRVSEDDIEWICERIEKHLTLGTLIVNFRIFSNDVLRNVLFNLLSKSYQTSYLDIEYLLSNYKEIKDSVQIDGPVLLDRIDGWLSRSTTENLHEKITDVSFFEDTFNCKSGKYYDLQIREWKRISSLSMSECKAALEVRGYDLSSMAIFTQYERKLPRSWVKSLESYLVTVPTNAENDVENEDLAIIVKWYIIFEKSKSTPKKIVAQLDRNSVISWGSYTLLVLLFSLRRTTINRSEEFINHFLVKYIDEEGFIEHLNQFLEFYQPLLLEAKRWKSPFREEFKKYHSDSMYIRLLKKRNIKRTT